MQDLNDTPRHDRWLRVFLPVGFVILAAGAVAAGVVTHRAKETRQAELPAGTTFVAALEHTVSTEHADVGDRITLETVDPVVVDQQTVVPAGATIQGEVTHARDGGRIAGAPELTLRFTELAADGETYRIDARPLQLRGKSDAGESAAEIGGGALAGGILGGVLGGGNDILKGAVLGAAAGTVVAVATKGGHIALPAGQKLKIRLETPVSVSYRANPDD